MYVAISLNIKFDLNNIIGQFIPKRTLTVIYVANIIETKMDLNDIDRQIIMRSLTVMYAGNSLNKSLS